MPIALLVILEEAVPLFQSNVAFKVLLVVVVVAVSVIVSIASIPLARLITILCCCDFYCRQPGGTNRLVASAPATAMDNHGFSNDRDQKRSTELGEESDENASSHEDWDDTGTAHKLADVRVEEIANITTY